MNNSDNSIIVTHNRDKCRLEKKGNEDIDYCD